MKFKTKNTKTWHLLLMLITLILVSCGGDGGSVEDPNLPSNLKLSYTIEGTSSQFPNGNGSGTITLNFSSDNTTLYKVNLGDGTIIETPSKTLTYTYTGSGLKTYQIYVSAYNKTNFVTANASITIFIASALIWSDEFNTDGAPNSSKWGYDLGAGGWGNNELQYYTNRPENVIVQNGVLKIKTLKESYNGSNYTSARMLTKDKFSFKYGKVEIRAKLPFGGGTWPALWMLGANISTVGWPACGEIDIMEHAGNNLNTVSSALHTPSSFGNTINYKAKYIPDVSTTFHVYGVEWTAEKIDFSVDGIVFYTYSPASKTAQNWPFDANQFIIINCAMGGNFGGAVDPNFTSSTFEIDYVRVYQ